MKTVAIRKLINRIFVVLTKADGVKSISWGWATPLERLYKRRAASSRNAFYDFARVIGDKLRTLKSIVFMQELNPEKIKAGTIKSQNYEGLLTIPVKTKHALARCFDLMVIESVIRTSALLFLPKDINNGFLDSRKNLIEEWIELSNALHGMNKLRFAFSRPIDAYLMKKELQVPESTISV